MQEIDPAPTKSNSDKVALRLVILYAVVLIVVITGVSVATWNRGNPIIMFVPVSIWEWSFAGGMVAVLYRLGSSTFEKPTGVQLYTWAISTPVAGLFFGATVYFIALAGAKLVGGGQNLAEAYWLNVIAFFGAFRGDIAIGALRRFFGDQVPDED